jgi:glyoxylase-like metal-dependent hydrolase (beta-lactamase superfamily II)
MRRTCWAPKASRSSWIPSATFPHVDVHDGDEIRFGHVILRFLETPGHTIESISIAVIDLDRRATPSPATPCSSAT